MFKLTKVGRTAIFSTSQKGIVASFHTIALGTGRYTSVDHDTKTALTTPVISAPLTVRSIGEKQMYLTAQVRHTARIEVYEIGLLSQDGVLLALASSLDTPLCILPANETQTLNLAIRV